MNYPWACDEGTDVRLAEVTDRVIRCCFTVHRTLGAGFLEKVYENALVLELERLGLKARQQFPIAVRYEGQVVGEFFADILVDDQVVCELKSCEALAREHEVQLVNYLAATGYDIGLLINFGRSVAVKRKYREFRQPEIKSNGQEHQRQIDRINRIQQDLQD